MKFFIRCICMCSLSCLSVSLFAQGKIKNDVFLQDLLRKNASVFLQGILDNPDTFRYQLIYTMINRDQNNVPHFTSYYLHVDKNLYFNPASTAKMPLAFSALEKLNRMKIQGVNKYTPMLTDSSFSKQSAVLTDTSSENGLPSVAQYIRKIFLVSDNDAYTRLYEFLGQQYLNENLWKKGYKDIRITRRFVPMNEEENKHTNQIRFVAGNKTIYTQAPAYSNVQFDFSKKILIGNAHVDNDNNYFPEPFDFTKANNIPLENLQQILQSVLFPESVKPSQRFQLTKDDYRFLYQYMSEMPRESKYPHYDTSEFFDSYCKFFFFKDGRGKIPEYIRSFNKTGWAYGFLTDVCYIVDFKHNIEFMLAGTIYTNHSQIINTDKYDYEENGYPFFKEVGNIIYNYELERKRKHQPDLSKFKLNYK